MTTEQTESVMLTPTPEQVWRRKKVKKARKARKACKGRRRLPSWGAIMNEPTPYKLIKVSDPGWEKDFVSKQEATAELLKHICSECREDSPTPDPDDIYSLLHTRCGCEFWYEPPDASLVLKKDERSEL